jgi:hypothetical protein
MDDALTFAGDGGNWDAVMMTYPHVIAHQGQYWMFYNGNAFGKTGFGYAVTEA